MVPREPDREHEARGAALDPDREVARMPAGQQYWVCGGNLERDVYSAVPGPDDEYWSRAELAGIAVLRRVQLPDCG